MAGTLTISTLSDGTNSTSATNAIQGSAKAWGSYVYTGSTPSLGSAYNISSITRNAAGNYTFAFTNSLPDSNYSVVSIPTYVATNATISNVFSKTTSSVNIQTVYVSGLVGQTTNFDYGVDFVIFD
jgi:hypothetical protein